MMDSPIPPPAPARLEAALARGAAEEAFAIVEAALQSPSESGTVLQWLRHGCAAFMPGEGLEGMGQALEEARTDSAAARLAVARAAFGAGHQAAALAIARLAFDNAPDGAEPALLLCAMLLKRGDPEAHRLLQRCLGDAPHPSQGWTDIGALLQERGKTEAALICFARGLPSVALAIRRGVLAKTLGRHQEAGACFAEAVRLNPKHTRAWFLLGTAAQDMRDFGLAAEAYGTVLTLDPTVAEAAVNLGTVLQDAGDLAGARQAYRRAVTTRSDTFGRVAQALSTSSKGELWLDLAALRRSLSG